MRRVLMMGGMLMLVLVGVLTVVRQQTPMPPWIYFERDNQLYRVTWDGNTEQVLPLKDVYFLGTSPDGRWLLWMPRYSYDLYLSRIDLLTRRLLVVRPILPVWSPDSNKIALVGIDNNMRVLNVTTNEIQGIHAPTIDEFVVQWSPDGKWLLFNGTLDGRMGLFRIHPDSTGFEEYTLAAGARNPVWSPTGDWIAFSREESNGTFEVYIMGVDGTGLQNLTNTPVTSESFMGWDARGEWLLYSDDNNEVFRMRSDRTTATVLIDNPPGAISWHDRWMIFAKFSPNNRSNLFRYNYLTNDLVQLTDSPVPDRSPYIIPPTDLHWHPTILAIGVFFLGTVALTRHRRRRTDHHLT